MSGPPKEVPIVAPVTLDSLTDYEDERGNVLRAAAASASDVRVTFRGSNNRLDVDGSADLGRVHVVFDCDNGRVRIGPSRRRQALSVSIRVGQDSRVHIGRHATSTETVVFSATEGTTITVGDDVMFASLNQIRADDGHPIFDVRTGRRVNVSRDVTIGDHVWLGRGAVMLGGSTIGDGSVLGYGAVLTRPIPNNCIAVGVPAKVVRRDIAWERPHLSLKEPFYKPDASTVNKSRYWRRTEDDGPRARLRRRIARSTVAPALRRVLAALRRRR